MTPRPAWLRKRKRFIKCFLFSYLHFLISRVDALLTPLFSSQKMVKTFHRIAIAQLTLTELQAEQSKLNDLNGQLDALMSELKGP